MREELEQKLIEKYPQIFNRPPHRTETSGHYVYPCVGDGWYDLLDTLCDTIQKAIDRRSRSIECGFTDPSEAIPQVIASQIKEKFGGLRFYFIGGNELTRGAIELAETMSYRICEQCGKPGSPREEGWIQTLCDEHAAERQHNSTKSRIELAETVAVPVVTQGDVNA